MRRLAATPSLTVIANPVSGRGKGRRYAQDLLAALAARGGRAELRWTEERGDGRRLARAALQNGADTVVVCGGDGTMQEAAGELAGSGARLVPGPAGKCNDFAAALGLSPEVERVAAAALAGASRPVDLVGTGAGYYCTVGAIGFDAEVSRFVDNLGGPLKGTPAYLYGVIRVLSGYRPAHMRLIHDDGVIEGPHLLVAVANSVSYGGSIPIAPRAVPDDGLLDLVLVRPAGFWRVMGLLPTLLRGRHESAPEVSFVRTRRVTIETSRPVELWADGEPVSVSPLTLEVSPGALRLGVEG